MSTPIRRRTGATLAALAVCASLTALTPAEASEPATSGANPISEIQQNTDPNAKEQVMLVDGEPFFFNGTQIRTDWIQNNTTWTDAEYQRVYNEAAEDGFTVANSHLNWLDIQPDQVYSATTSGYVAAGTHADTNFSSEESLKVRFDPENPDAQAISYFQFDFSDISGSSADASKIRIRVNEKDAGTAHLRLYGIADNSWDASTMTWNSGSPNHDDYAITGEEGIDYVDLGGTPSWDPIDQVHVYDFDVTDFLNDIAYPQGKLASFMLVADGSNSVGVSIDGAGASVSPKLVISRADVWDYSWVDKMVGWAESAEMKMEILWLGSQIVKVTADNSTPYYVIRNYEKAQAKDGSTLVKKGGGPDVRKNTTYMYMMSLDDPQLRELEYTALQSVFDHIAQYDDAHGNKHTVIGAQLVNEPGAAIFGGRSYAPYSQAAYEAGGYTSASKFMNQSFMDYSQNLGAAVKQSDYPVYTRINFHSAEMNYVYNNEQMKARGETSYVDFVGYDPYFDDTNEAYLYGQGLWDDRYYERYDHGGNLPMVMENSGRLDNGDYLALATIAGGAVYNQYQYIGGGPFGMYFYDFAAQNTNVEGIAATNNWLKTFAYDLATKSPDSNGGDQLKFFNARANESSTSTKNIRSVPVTYTTTNKGVGVAIEKADDTIALASKTDALFTLDGLAQYGPVEVTSGHYDANDEWSVEAAKGFTTVDGDIVLELEAYETVQVVTTHPIAASATTTVLDEGFDSQATWASPEGWTVSPNDTIAEVYPKPGDADKSLRLRRTSSVEGETYADKEIDPVDGTVRVSARILKDATSQGLRAPYVYDSSGSLIAGVDFTDAGKIAYVTSEGGSVELQGYITRKFYEVTLEIDTARDVLSLAIDGKVMADDVPLVQATDDVAKVRFSTGDKSIAYIDKVTVAATPIAAPTVDLTRPEAILVSPATAGPFSAVHVQVDASDNQGLATLVANIYRDGTLVKSTQTKANGATSATHEATVNLPDGSYTVKYNAHDVAGNVSATGQAAFVVDTTAPTVTVKTGASFTVDNGDAYDVVSFKLYDSGKVDRVEINGVVKDLVNNAWSDVNTVRAGSLGAVAGSNTLRVYDVAGNVTTRTFELS
ncbi:DUF4978 domain-containing protein [Demequina sp. NBRC 110055]|uniref:CBM96 family carbohydrate-binding protein n=1 Tax=Demequina sp. NBRC 110055 TaxID=1570344 RepID=UPI001185985E|nr:DUF4978 domain-containing protein [Demequina sp. NBRC 110055]